MMFSDRVSTITSQIEEWDWPQGQSPSWLVGQWIPRGHVTLLAGEGGRGKSRLALQLATAVCTDRNYHPDRDWVTGGPMVDVQEGSALYLGWEDTGAEVAHRLYSTHERIKSTELARQAFQGRFKIVDMAGIGALWNNCQPTAAGRELDDIVISTGFDLVVIDPIAAAFGGNENDRSDVRGFVSWVSSWCRLGASAVLISHPSKSGYAYSGSTDWHSASRSVISYAAEKHEAKDLRSRKIEVPHATRNVLSVVKSNYGQIPQSWVVDTARWGWLAGERR